MMNAADVDLDEFTAFEGGAHTAFSSPAVATSFDFNGSMSSSNCDLSTISPVELQLQDHFVMSAPNSSALTALTSPSIGDASPAFDGYDMSPNFGSADFGDNGGDSWYSLFPTDSNGSVNVNDSPATRLEDFENPRSGSGSRRKSSANSSPTTGSGRHSSVSGVNSRKKEKPLPPIIVEDPQDTVAMKRARNTLAARKSRERKVMRFEELEERIAKLEAERDHWKSIALSQAAGHN